MQPREVPGYVGDRGGAVAGGETRMARHVEFVPREGAVVFRCEICRSEMRDLRGVFLAHRDGAGWTIECSGHGGAEHVMDGGHLFGGGLRALELFGDLAQARWFDAGDLFRTLLRLRAQAAGVYHAPTDAQS